MTYHISYCSGSEMIQAVNLPETVKSFDESRNRWEINFMKMSVLCKAARVAGGGRVVRLSRGSFP